jgi:hypothetical protein
MRTAMLKVIAVLAMCFGLNGCADETSHCGDGEAVDVNGASYCVYKESIVIVGGFDCPASMPYRIDFEQATVCGSHGFGDVDVPQDICARVLVPCTEPEPEPEPDAGVCNNVRGDCNDVATDGCETPLNTSSDCGVCGVACSGDNVTCESGTCLPTRENCSNGIVYASVEECQDTPRTCFTLPNGDTCGVCTGALDCTSIDCSGYSAPTLPPPECAEGFGVWEGVCGSVRYRVASGGYGGPTLYWDNASGELLAAKLSNDILSYCDDTALSMVQGDALVPAACDIVLDASTSLCPQ